MLVSVLIYSVKTNCPLTLPQFDIVRPKHFWQYEKCYVTSHWYFNCHFHDCHCDEHLYLFVGQSGFPWRRKGQPTPVFLPGKSHEQRSLAGCSPWGHSVEHNWMTNQQTTTKTGFLIRKSPTCILCPSFYLIVCLFLNNLSTLCVTFCPVLSFCLWCLFK